MMRHLTTLMIGLATLSTVAAAQTTTTQPPARRLPTATVRADTNNILTVQNDRAVPVTIRADARATHQSVVTAMDVAGRAGFRQINIATVHDGQEGG